MRAIALFLSLVAFAVFPAAAQSIREPICTGQGPCPQTRTSNQPSEPAAPVGHRQPTMGDLTPRVRQAETTGSAPSDPLGPLPQLCRDC